LNCRTEARAPLPAKTGVPSDNASTSSIGPSSQPRLTRVADADLGMAAITNRPPIEYGSALPL
jgi:hypothetical protein